MYSYSYNEYYEMVRCYILSDESLSGAQRLYEAESVPRFRRQGLGNVPIPSRQTILAAKQRLLDYGQFTAPIHPGRGRTRLPDIDLRASTRDTARRRPSPPREAITKKVYVNRKLMKRTQSSVLEPKPKLKRAKQENDKCCCCLEKDGDRNLWFSGKNSDDDNVYGKLLHECFDINIGHPKLKEGHKICNNCKEQLKQALQFKRQVLKCQEKLSKCTIDLINTYNSSNSDSELPDVYDLPDDNLAERKGTLTDMSDEDDEDYDQPLVALKKVSEKVQTELEQEKKDVAAPNVNEASVVIMELEQDNNNQDEIVDEMEPEPEAAGVIPELGQGNSPNENDGKLEAEPGVDGITVEIEQDNNNQDENVDNMQPEPTVGQIILEIEQDNNKDESVDDFDPKPSVSGVGSNLKQDKTLPGPGPPKVENIGNDDEEEDPIKIIHKNGAVNSEVDDESNMSVKCEPDSENCEEIGDENSAMQEEEVKVELLQEEVPDPLNGVNNSEVFQEPKEEIDCVSSTIDDSRINEHSTLPIYIGSGTKIGQANAVKHMDAIFNCTLREMLSRPSNILQDLNRRGHDMLQSFNERLAMPQPKQSPQLRTVRKSKRPCTESIPKMDEVPKPNTSREQSKAKKVVSNYLDLLR